MDAIGIARTGLQAGMVRLTASASNIANANSTGPVPAASSGVGAAAGTGSSVYQPVRAQLSPLAGGGVQASIVPQNSTYSLRYDPSSGQANAQGPNAQGMVAAPDVDLASELVDQATASQDVLANLSVIETVSKLEQRTIEMWG